MSRHDWCSASNGSTFSLTNPSTCWGARPMKSMGLTKSSNFSWTAANRGSAEIIYRVRIFPSHKSAHEPLIRASKSFALPNSLTCRPASMEWTRMASWSTCLSPPATTHCISIASVAMKGSSNWILLLTTAGQTCHIISGGYLKQWQGINE